MSQGRDHVLPRMPVRPRWQLPHAGCDCHAHVFGPYEQFPLVNPTPYAPPLAPAPVHREMLARATLGRGVLVQPGAFGTDPSNIIDALRQGNDKLRGIAAASAEVTDAALDAWHAAGVRGLRFNEVPAPSGGRYPGAVPLEELRALAPRLAQRGWHAEIWTPIDTIVPCFAWLRELGIPIVLDHMGGFVASRGTHDQAFRALLAALVEGWLWVKLVLCRRSENFPDYPELRPFHEALVTANSGRVVWGSDWPYVRLGERTPDVGHVLDLFCDWTPDASVRARILVANPAALYAFEAVRIFRRR